MDICLHTYIFEYVCIYVHIHTDELGLVQVERKGIHVFIIEYVYIYMSTYIHI